MNAVAIASQAAGQPPAVFRGLDAGKVTVQLRATPGRASVIASLLVNQATAATLLKHFTSWRSLGRYESAPAMYEQRARDALANAAPELLAAAAFASAFDPFFTEVSGLQPLRHTVPSPLDGVVDEDSAASHVFYLVSVFAAGFRLGGFAYGSENDGRILRAVAPNPRVANQAGSQGYAEDLNWHQDNANKPMPATAPLLARIPNEFMNPYQAFAVVNVDNETPMEILALDDVLAELRRDAVGDTVDVLQRPEFALRPPASHSGGTSLERVPLLQRDAAGRFHGRFHATNASGLTPRARDALSALAGCIAHSTASIRHVGTPGSLVLYSNTRSLHRRSRYQPSFHGDDRYFVRVYLAPTTAAPRIQPDRCIGAARLVQNRNQPTGGIQ